MERLYVSVFEGCTSLNQITFPGSIIYIGADAFKDCSGMSVALVFNPDTVFNGNVFSGCAQPFTIYGWPGSTAETCADSCSFLFEPFDLTGSCGDNVTFTFNLSSRALTISGTGPMWNFFLEENPWYAARSLITSVSVGRGVTTIGDNSFIYCTSLRSVYINSTVNIIGEYAFAYCSDLNSVSLPGNLMYIGKSAFMRCTSLQEITIPSKTATIELRAFAGCTSLADVTFLGSVPTFGSRVFLDVTANAVYPVEDTSWTADVLLDYGGHLTWTPSVRPDFFLPASLAAIEADAFHGIDAVAVVIPVTVTAIDGNPFADSAVRYIFGYAGSAAQSLAEAWPDQFTFVQIDDNWMAAH